MIWVWLDISVYCVHDPSGYICMLQRAFKRFMFDGNRGTASSYHDLCNQLFRNAYIIIIRIWTKVWITVHWLWKYSHPIADRASAICLCSDCHILSVNFIHKHSMYPVAVRIYSLLWCVSVSAKISGNIGGFGKLLQASGDRTREYFLLPGCHYFHFHGVLLINVSFGGIKCDVLNKMTMGKLLHRSHTLDRIYMS